MAQQDRMPFILSGLNEILKQPAETMYITHMESSDTKDGTWFSIHLDSSTASEEAASIWQEAHLLLDVEQLVTGDTVEVTTGWDYYRDTEKRVQVERRPIEVWNEAMTPTEQCETVATYVRKLLRTVDPNRFIVVVPKYDWE